MLFRSDDLVLDVDAERMPIIGYDNKVTALNVTSTTADVDFPITNVANPLTHLKWVGGVNTAGVETITISALSGTVSYLAIVRHNLGTIGARIAVTSSPDEFTKVLLHFNGADASTTFTDETGKTWTAVGNSQIDTAESKFGGASGLFDEVGDYISTPDHSDFILAGFDFTIDCWFKSNAASGEQRLAGQRAGVIATDSFDLLRNSSGFMSAELSDGSNLFTITGTTAFTDTVNPGWHHLAFVRIGNTLKLFIDGVQEGGDLAFSGVVPNSTTELRVGSFGGDPGWLGWIDEFRISVGIARWTTTFTPPVRPYGKLFEADIGALLHFDGEDGSTTFIDETGKTWTASGAMIDTAQSKFGGASGFFDGISAEFISTPDHSDFALDASDWTIECWFNCTVTPGGFPGLAGQSNDGSMDATISSFRINRTNTGEMRLTVANGTTNTTLTGTTQFTNVLNTGWHHIASVRTGNILKMFIDGVQEGGNVSFTGTVPNSSHVLEVGKASQAGTQWGGWIDEFRFSVGVARWTADFTPPTRPYGVVIEDDLPLIFQFDPLVASVFQIQITSTTAPEIAVIYLGDLLTLERSIVPDAPHVPVNLGRRTKTVQGRSTSGNYLGSIVLSESRESLAKFMWFDPDWYRANFDPFVVAAQDVPFLFAWNPAEMPEDVGYCWLVEDPMPEFDPVTRRVGVDLKMQGVA